MVKKILVGTDGSEHAGRATAMAADLARRYGASLVVVTVVEPAYLPPEAALMADRIETARREEAERLVSAEAARLAPSALEVRSVVLYGAPAEEMLRAASELGADMVVVGSRGRGAVARMLLGSVSDRLVRQSHQPVLVVH